MEFINVAWVYLSVAKAEAQTSRLSAEGTMFSAVCTEGSVICDVVPMHDSSVLLSCLAHLISYTSLSGKWMRVGGAFGCAYDAIKIPVWKLKLE